MRSLLAITIGATLFNPVWSIPATYSERHAPHFGKSAGVRTAKAVYFQSNKLEGNTIIALKVGQDGNIAGYTTTETCGNGAAGILDTGEMAGVDALFSQGSVVVKQNVLLAVNAGSNTVSMFTINPSNATDLTLIGTPAPTLGDFPNSIAYCPKLRRACVVNAGEKDGVTCYSVDLETGLKCLDKSPRPLNINQSTPPKGPAGTVSDIFFSPDSKNLLLTVKGNPAINVTGFVGLYPVKNGCVSKNIIKSHPDNTTVLFGSLMTSPTEIFATDAAFGIARLRLNPDGSTSTLSTSNIDSQKATCWVAKSKLTGSVYVTDVGQPRIIEFDPTTGKQLGTPLTPLNGQGGYIDNAVGGDFLYNLSPTEKMQPSKDEAKDRTGIAIVDLSGGKGKMKDLGTFWVPGEVAGKFSMGMAVYV